MSINRCCVYCVLGYLSVELKYGVELKFGVGYFVLGVQQNTFESHDGGT